MMTDQHRPARRERLVLAAAAVRGVLSGATHPVISWLIDWFVNN
jgi:hypothetical protein